MKRLNESFGKTVKTAAITAAAIAGLCLATARAEEPGRVRWHADLEGARAAARESGKPVLLFQMMGRLDDRFC